MMEAVDAVALEPFVDLDAVASYAAGGEEEREGVVAAGHAVGQALHEA